MDDLVKLLGKCAIVFGAFVLFLMFASFLLMLVPV